MPGFLRLKRGREDQPQDEILVSIPEKRRAVMKDIGLGMSSLNIYEAEEKDDKRVLGRFKRVDTTSSGIGMWMNQNKLTKVVATKEDDSFVSTLSTNVKTTISISGGRVHYSNCDIEFDNCMCNFGDDGKILPSSFSICMSLISSGQVNIDKRCSVSLRYSDYTLLTILIVTDDMTHIADLLNLGADCFIDLKQGMTPASFFWDKMLRSKNDASSYYEIYCLMNEQLQKKDMKEKKMSRDDDGLYDVYMCVSEDEMNDNMTMNCMRYEEIEKENGSMLYSEMLFAEDDEMDEDDDSEDSNAEGYYDRVCGAYGNEESDHDWDDDDWNVEDECRDEEYNDDFYCSDDDNDNFYGYY